jgi:hypothetical protein
LIQGGRPGFISWSIAPLNDIRIAYVAENEHHRAICFALDDTHFFIVVRFKDSRQPDLGFYLRTTYEERGPDSASLERMVESLPYFLPSTKRQPDHPLGQDGNIDAKVFMRDFFSALLPLY